MATPDKNNYDCLLLNGDSYSESVDKFKVYGDYLGDHLGIPVKNFALSGSSNDRILRTTIEYCNQIKKEYNNPLVVVGWSFVRRIEVWYYGNKDKILRRASENEHSRFVTLDWLLANDASDEHKAMILDDLHVHKKLTDFYTNLYLFGNLMKSLNLDYFCFSAADNTDCPIHCFPYINGLHQTQWVKQNRNMFQLHNFCVKKWAFENDDECESTGHLSPSGHKKFATVILEELNKR